MAFYDFFERIGTFKNGDLGKFRGLMKSGVYDMIQLDGLCIVCRMPVQIWRDADKKLHSTTEPAVQFKDGYSQHYLHGIFFGEDLWKRVCEKKLSLKELMSIKNLEQRYVAMKLYVGSEMLEKFGVLMDESGRENHLYATPNLIADSDHVLTGGSNDRLH